LGTEDGEKNIYKLAKTSEMKIRDLNGVRCIKDEDQKVLVKEEHIKESEKILINFLMETAQKIGAN
jgi:hypothetical protein